MRWVVPAVLLLLCAPLAHAQQEGVRRDVEEPEPEPEPTLTKPPSLLQAVAPEYPPEELAAKREAQVLVGGIDRFLLIRTQLHHSSSPSSMSS